jgi:hypothetical protein
MRGFPSASARHQVDGAFDTLECATHDPRKRTQHGCLADPDAAFEKHMTAGKQGDIDETDGLRLADHDSRDLVFDLQCMQTPVLKQFARTHRCNPL